MTRVVPVLSVLLLLASPACSSPPVPRARSSDEVAANSASEARLAGVTKLEPAAARPDPSQPYLEPVGGDATPSAPPKTGKVTKEECSQLFDRYLELSMGADERLKDLPTELVAQAKAQARQEKGDPCEKEKVSRAKYTCAMASTTPKAWEKCMK